MKNYKFAAFIFWFLLVVIPFFFLPFTLEYYYFNKFSLLFLTSIVSLCGWIFLTIKNRSFYINISKKDLYILVFLATLTIANLIASPNITSITSPMGPIFYWLLFFLYIFFKTHYQKIDHQKVLLAIIIVGSLVGTIQTFWLLDGWKTINSLTSMPAWIKSSYWSPLGNIYNSFSYLLFVLTISGFLFFSSFHNYLLEIFSDDEFKKPVRRVGKDLVLYSIFFTINICFFLICAYYLFVVNQSNKPLVINLYEGWFVLTGGLRNLQVALLGVGSNNFALLFAANRPPVYTGYLISQIYPILQATYVFQIISEFGLLTFFAFLLMLGKFISSELPKNISQIPLGKIIRLLLICLALIFLLTAINQVLIFLFFVLLYLHEVEEGKIIHHDSKIPFAGQKLAILLILIIVSISTYAFSRLYLASYYHRMALNSQTSSIRAYTYSLIFTSLNQNPQSHQAKDFLAQISKSSALSLIQDKDFANNPGKQKTLVDLLSQAERSEKEAIQMENNPVYWHNLARIYEVYSSINPEKFLPLAEKSYKNALALDPRSSYYHFSLGSLYLTNNNLNLALNEFNDSIVLDPFFANGYYNLFIAYNNAGLLTDALNALKMTVNIIPATHKQYDQIVKELISYEQYVRESTMSSQLQENTQPNKQLSPTPGLDKINNP